MKNWLAEKLQIKLLEILTPNRLKEIFEYCSEWKLNKLNIVRMKTLAFPTFDLGDPLRITDVS